MARVHPKERSSQSSSEDPEDSDPGQAVPVVPRPQVSAPARPEDSQSLPKFRDVESDVFEGLGEARMCLPTLSSTFIASVGSSALTFVGLFALGLSELGLPLPRPTWMTLTCRFAGWMFLFVLPVLGVAVPPLRNFLLWGLEPNSAVSHKGDKCPTRNPLPWMQQMAWVTIYATLTCLPIHEGHPFGFFLVFALGNILSMPAGLILARLVGPAILSPQYVRSVGPVCIFFPIVGFGILVSGYLALRRACGVWVGVLMPLLLTVYEFVGMQVAARNFVKYFLTRQEVREQYAGTNQGILLSTSICTFHALAEGARLTLLYIDHLKHQSFDILLPIISAVIWNVFVRLGCVDRIITTVTRGWFKPHNASKLLRDAGYCMGYPRMGAIAALLLARLSLGSPMILTDMEGFLWAFIIGAELVEDLLSYALWRAGVDFSPVKMFATDEEVEQMSEKRIVRRLSKLSQQGSSDALAVVPQPSRKSTCSAPSAASAAQEVEVQRLATVESVKWEVRERHDFKYGPVDFGCLPFWAHLLPAALSQFHTVLAVTVFSGGLVYALGLCPHNPHTEMSPEGGVLWWPIPDGSEICT